MGAYILRRLLLMIPTIIGIMAISFAVVQFAPGGPVEQVIADLTNAAGSDRLSGAGGDLVQGAARAASIAARKGSIRNSSPSSRSNSASTSRHSSASSR